MIDAARARQLRHEIEASRRRTGPVSVTLIAYGNTPAQEHRHTVQVPRIVWDALDPAGRCALLGDYADQYAGQVLPGYTSSAWTIDDPTDDAATKTSSPAERERPRPA